MIDKPYNLTDATHYRLGAFPPTNLDYERLLGPLDEAASSFGRYDSKLQSMENGESFFAHLRRQDAVASSRMEGIVSTVEKVYRLEAEDEARSPDPYREAGEDDIETYLCSRAMWNAQYALEAGARLGEHLIRAAHHQLLSSERNAHKRPGSYRVQQNYIGDVGSGKFHYVPIAPEHLQPAMTELVRFMNGEAMRPLIRTAIAHAEFEALHPFDDGNGRTGRMLITLMLWKLGVLSQPNLFVSGFFESNRSEYVERLRSVSATGDWTGWICFFLEAMHEQATVSVQTADAIYKLHGEMRGRFREVLNSQYSDQILEFVFTSPVFRNDGFVKCSGIPPSSARVLSRRLVEAGLLRSLQPSSGRRAALYAFDPLLDLLRV